MYLIIFAFKQVRNIDDIIVSTIIGAQSIGYYQYKSSLVYVYDIICQTYK